MYLLSLSRIKSETKTSPQTRLHRVFHAKPRDKLTGILIPRALPRKMLNHVRIVESGRPEVRCRGGRRSDRTGAGAINYKKTSVLSVIVSDWICWNCQKECQKMTVSIFVFCTVDCKLLSV